MKKSKLKYIIASKKHTRSFLLILSILAGIGAGITALILKTAVFELQEYLTNSVWQKNSFYLLFVYPVAGILMLAILRKYIFHDQGRHNITSLLYAISKQNSRVPGHKIYSSVFGAIITAGFGGSIGLESPIISSGASIGSNLGKKFNLEYKEVTLLLACGASGAIAAIFNTPIAGIVFSFEVLLLDLNRFSLIPLLIASVTGALTTWAFYPNEIPLHFEILHQFELSQLPWYLLLAIIGGLISSYFTRTFLYFEQQFDKFRNRITGRLTGGLALGVLITLFPPLWGEGFKTIKLLISGRILELSSENIIGTMMNEYGIMIFLLLLIFLKVIATVTTIRGGGIGGIFAPSLFTGAIMGFLFAYGLNHTGLFHLSTSNFTLVGMASVLGGVLHAPLTGIFLIAEITQGYELIVPLMLTTTIAYITSKKLSPDSIITYQLSRTGELITHHKDKAVLHFLDRKRIIETDFDTVRIDQKLGELVDLISKSHRNIFPVVDKAGYLIGLIRLDKVRRIMFKKGAYTMPVWHLMETPPDVIEEKDTMETIVKKFNQAKAWNLPVIDNGIYQGMVSRSKLFSVYREVLVKITDD
ncbi:H(+)/Cl(-) exchange transporter ClcA [Salinivirga cyanobacteriivorans]|uniref:H(+)/Cl(-) exchange transporter ClcA n=1 Tax=Salinivirga cyanobacteriivorans TaxID=1307839 RepID=A0A0S2HXZ9_9BACT|nr:chloride channel protein [Salinivirga cyanobacteriivorans]ALO14925.1 H(+)/Cl(-) exchange transporter ClcA [Salinivirga cyanobacteriivorans]